MDPAEGYKKGDPTYKESSEKNQQRDSPYHIPNNRQGKFVPEYFFEDLKATNMYAEMDAYKMQKLKAAAQEKSANEQLRLETEMRLKIEKTEDAKKGSSNNEKRQEGAN